MKRKTAKNQSRRKPSPWHLPLSILPLPPNKQPLPNNLHHPLNKNPNLPNKKLNPSPPSPLNPSRLLSSPLRLPFKPLKRLLRKKKATKTSRTMKNLRRKLKMMKILTTISKKMMEKMMMKNKNRKQIQSP